MENSSIFIPDESVLHDIIDQINEVILILDPTVVSGTFLLSLSTTEYDPVVKAHLLLLSASQKTLDMMIPYESLALQSEDSDFNDSSNIVLNQVIHDTICTVADLHRSLIVSSYLQLFHLSLFNSDKKNNPRSSIQFNLSLDNDDYNGYLRRTIQRSISILQCLSLIVRQSALYSSNDTSALHSNSIRRNNIRGDGDWHDEFLPIPQYSLLQDCFLRKDRVCLEDGTVFGKDEREISLELDKYDSNDHILLRIMKCRETAILESFQSVSTNNAECSCPQQYLGKSLVTEDTMDIFHEFPMNHEQLQHEENILLDVAFPDTVCQSFTHHRGRSGDDKFIDSFGTIQSKKKRKLDIINNSIITYDNIIHMACKFGMSRFVWNQYMHGPVAVHKRSWLRIHRNRSSSEGKEITDLERVYCLLYASGLLLTFTDESLNEASTGYEISHLSSCEPIIDKTILRFSIQNVDVYEINSNRSRIERKISVVIDLDEGSEDILSEVYSWVTTISRLVDFVSEKKKHRDLIQGLWN